MEWYDLFISLISGNAGGNIAGLVLSSDKNLGAFGNTIAGIFGEVIGNYIMQYAGVIAEAGILGPQAIEALPKIDLSNILANIGTSGACGAILMALAGWIKSKYAKSLLDLVNS